MKNQLTTYGSPRPCTSPTVYPRVSFPRFLPAFPSRVSFPRLLALALVLLTSGVHASVTISSQPRSAAVVLGDKAVFTVVATGAGTLSYQWKKDGVPINGARDWALVLNAATFTDAGQYTVDVTDETPITVGTTAARLEVNSPSAGSVDLTFQAGSSIDRRVYVVALQDDGKILVGGEFTTINGALRGRVARLNADRSPDSTFGHGQEGAVGDGYCCVYALALQNDGKVIIAGRFSMVNGTIRRGLARLNRDGSLDTGFGQGLAGVEGTPFAVALQHDGKVLIGGEFNRVHGAKRERVARLNSDGSLDTGFNDGLSGANQSVFALAVQSDGKVVIGGSFTELNGTARDNVARLNPDGSLDPGFHQSSIEGGNVDELTVQSDGKVLIGGGFYEVQKTTRRGMARLNGDGSLDIGFGSGLPGANGWVGALALQSDGKVVIGGSFSEVNGEPRGNVARLNPDGSLDLGFRKLVVPEGEVRTLAVQSDGGVLVGGDLNPYISNSDRGRLAYLTQEGSLDDGFGVGQRQTGIFPGVMAMAVQSDGKVVIGGTFSEVNQRQRGRLARLNSNGSLDLGFAHGVAGTDMPVVALAVQNDGKVLVGGWFTKVNGTARGRIARLNSNGSLDTGFGHSLAGVDEWLHALALQSDGKVLIGGDFTKVNGTARGRVARLHNDGSLDADFGDSLTGANRSVYALAMQSDGRILIGGDFTEVNGTARGRVARLNGDGSLDIGFGNGMAGADGTIFALAVQSDGNILVGGSFGKVNGYNMHRLARLNSNGSRAATFTSPFAPMEIAHSVQALALQADDSSFIMSFFQGQGTEAVARLRYPNPDGKWVTSTSSGSAVADKGIEALVLLPDGKLLIGGYFTKVNGHACWSVARLHASTVDADLTGLKLSSGALIPAFSGGTITYSAAVTAGSLRVTPTSRDAAAKILIRVNGGAYNSVTSGRPSDPLPLNPGPNFVEVQVTSADGTVVKPYSVTVTNPLAQTIAIQATAENLTFTLHGMPDAKVTVQSAPTVTGPWAVEKTLTLDGSGTGTVNLDHENHISARFYRTMSE